MRTTILCVICLLIGASFGALASGVFAYRRGSHDGFRAATEIAADHSEERASWAYPRVNHTFASSTGGGGHLGGLVIPSMDAFVVTTLDDFDAVEKYYADQCGPDGLSVSGHSTSGSAPRASYIQCRHLDDSRRRDETGIDAPRNVKLKIFARQTAHESLAIILSQGAGERETHIVTIQQ